MSSNNLQIKLIEDSSGHIQSLHGAKAWRMNLIAVSNAMGEDSNAINLYIAVNDEVWIYTLKDIHEKPNLPSIKLLTGSGSSTEGIRLDIQHPPINSIRIGKFTPDKEALVSVDDIGQACVWILSETMTEQPAITFANQVSTWGIAIHHHLLAFSANSHEITILKMDGTDDETVLRLKGHQHNIPTVDFSPCGRYLASCSIDGTCRIWSVEDGTCLSAKTMGTEWGWTVNWIQPKDFLSSLSPLAFPVRQNSPVIQRVTLAGPVESENSSLEESMMQDGFDGDLNLDVEDYVSETSSNYISEDSESPILATSVHFTPLSTPPKLLLLHTDATNLSLLSWDMETLSTISSVCRENDHDHERRLLDQFDRLCLVSWIPEASLALVASQKGRIALVRLVVSKNGDKMDWHLHQEVILPRSPPLSPLLGINCIWTESKVDSSLSRGILYLLYYDRTLLVYELTRPTSTVRWFPVKKCANI